MAYPLKDRQKALSMLNLGVSKKEICATLNISRSALNAWEALASTGSIKHRSGGIRTITITKEKLEAILAKTPDALLREIAIELQCSESAVSIAIKNMA